MKTEKKEGFWDSYKRDLYSGGLQELGHIMDMFVAARSVGLVGLGAIGTGAAIEIASKKSPLKGVGKFLGRSIAGVGVVTLVGGVSGELFCRKANQVYNEARLDRAQKRKEVTKAAME